MSSLAEIRGKVGLISDDETRHICLQLIDEVAARLARENQGLWTLSVFSRWIGREPNDAVLRRSVHFLATKRDAQLLEMHFIFYKPEDEADPGRKIDDGEVAEAIASGFLIDPDTGEARTDFADTLVPYYVPAPNLGVA